MACYNSSPVTRRKCVAAVAKRLLNVSRGSTASRENISGSNSDLLGANCDNCDFVDADCLNNGFGVGENDSEVVKDNDLIADRQAVSNVDTTPASEEDVIVVNGVAFENIRAEVIRDEVIRNDTDDLTVNLGVALADWAVQFNITLRALTALLCILRLFHPELPKTGTTLLHTKRNFKIARRAGGEYFYFGIVTALTQTLNTIFDKLTSNSVLNLQLNIDGLPLFKSSGASFWPVLGLLQGFKLQSPVLISLFCGATKPNCLNEYFDDLINDINEVGRGFLFRGKALTIKICNIVCDAPARAFVKAIKGHTAYHGCDRCMQVGEHIANRMTFPACDAKLRTDDSFLLLHDDEHHQINNGNVVWSPFVNASIGMVSQFPHDYMQLVCLGVVKRIINLWLSGPLACRLSGSESDRLSELLINMRKFIPAEFARKPRGLKEVGRWKATEFRLFLFYTGPVALSCILAAPLYKNFLLLFVAMFCLASPSLSRDYCDYAKQLMTSFVQHFAALYGNENIVYNVHNLIHLVDDVKLFGCIDNISGFPFENYLHTLKKLVRKPQYPVAQVVRRLSEIDAAGGKIILKDDSIVLKRPHNRGYCSLQVEGIKMQYSEIHCQNFCIKTSVGDNCIMINNNLGLVKNIVSVNSVVYLVYQLFVNKKSFFSYPLDSELLNIYSVSELDVQEHVSLLNDSIRKFVLMPTENAFVAVPLLHLV
jgi:hypothetical protein